MIKLLVDKITLVINLSKREKKKVLCKEWSETL